MNKNDFKLMCEDWNVFINEESDDIFELNKQKEIINAVWTIVQILDPTPITGIPDLYNSIEAFKKERNIVNAIDCLFNGITMLPFANIVKKIKNLNKVGKKSTFEILRKEKDSIVKSFENIKDLDDAIEGINDSDLMKEKYSQIKNSINKTKEKYKDLLSKELNDIIIPNLPQRQRKRNMGHIN
jgi:hypothetical protein